MRLLHTATLKLEEFSDSRIPPYAILSHRWGEGEVTFSDMQHPSARGTRVGFGKLQNICSLAAKYRFEYVWLDTCCIDKTSSVELSEAINSMYRWYQEAVVCYAYLADVPSNTSQSPSDLTDFSRSKWFTRGWTLQELIAPSTVIFLNEKWQEIGTKSTLQQVISEITGIPFNILLGDDLESTSVAQRMSWVSKRETTRVEDLAYCLMGMFGVHMPLLYGEGERAFIRLQEEIMKVSDDYSLFAWRSMQEANENDDGLLATSPAAFVHSSNIVRLNRFQRFSTFDDPLTISNKGIHLTVPFIDALPFIDGQNLGLAILNCTEKGKDKLRFAIRVKNISLTKGYFVRHQSWKFELLNVEDASLPPYTLRKICVKQGRLTLKRKTESWNNTNSLALVLSDRGKYKEAEQMHRQALKLWEKVLGAGHPNVMTSINNLALVLERQGKYEEAEEMNQRRIKLYERGLGKEHPRTLASIDDLAAVLERQGKYEAAEEIYRQALEKREVVLGKEHSDTLTSIENLAYILLSQGKYEAAEVMQRQALEGREKVLGKEHPKTLTSIERLAYMLGSQGKYEAAEVMHRQALEGREKVLGKEHPETLSSMNNLVWVLSTLGKYKEALTYSFASTLRWHLSHFTPLSTPRT